VTPEPEQQPEQPDDIEKAYSDALTEGKPADDYGLPAKEVTSLGGQPIEHAEAQARRQLEAIEKMAGSSEEPGEQQQPEPEQPPAQRQEVEEPGSEEPEELGPVEAARYLLGADEPTPEQAQALAALEEERALRSGEVAQEAVRVDDELQRGLDQLEAACPGLTGDACLDAMERPWQMIRDRYGDQIAVQPEVIRQVYEAAGGEERFGPDAPEQVAAREQEAYEHAMAPLGEVDPFGFPVQR
jgi:hypothetical protein